MVGYNCQRVNERLGDGGRWCEKKSMGDRLFEIDGGVECLSMSKWIRMKDEG